MPFARLLLANAPKIVPVKQGQFLFPKRTSLLSCMWRVGYVTSRQAQKCLCRLLKHGETAEIQTRNSAEDIKLVTYGFWQTVERLVGRNGNVVVAMLNLIIRLCYIWYLLLRFWMV